MLSCVFVVCGFVSSSQGLGEPPRVQIDQIPKGLEPKVNDLARWGSSSLWWFRILREDLSYVSVHRSSLPLRRLLS